MARHAVLLAVVLVLAVAAGVAGRRYCANSHRAVRCPRTCRPENCVRRPTGADGAFYTRCYQIRPPICQTIYWEEIAATNMYDYVYLNTTMNQDDGELCYSTCREEPFRGICLASDRGVNGVDYCKQIDCRRLKMPNQSGCHQPRDFHAPTCSECEVIFPLACGSNEGGILKGWKARLAELNRQKDLAASIAYNASLVDYSKFVNSSYDETYRWLNGASVPEVPGWFSCSKMHNERLDFLRNLAMEEMTRTKERASMLPAGLQEQLINSTLDITAKQATGFGDFNPCTTGESSDCPDVADLVSSEGLPYSMEWEANECDRYYEHELRTFHKDDENDADDESDDDERGFVGTLDWLPPWAWEPWNTEWQPLPQGQQWYWETFEPEVTANVGDSGLSGAPGFDDFQDTIDLVKTKGSVALALHESSDFGILGSDLAINSDTVPNVVQVVFQLADDAERPFEEDEAALIRAVAFISSVPIDTVEVTETYRDLTQEIATVSVAVTTEDPLAVSIALARADRNGQMAATLKGADFHYLEVSMTSTVAYSHEIEQAMDSEDLQATMVEAEKESIAIYLAAAAGAVLFAGVVGILVMLLVIRKRRAAAYAAADAAASSPTKEASVNPTPTKA